MNYSKLKSSNYFVFAFVTMFVSLILSCKSKEDPAPVPNLPPLAFNVTPSLSTNGQDVILRWNKSKDPEGDVVTYAVVYKDTLVKNLSDTTYTIKNLPFETEIKGTVVAKDTKGNKTVSSFSTQTGMDYVAIPDINFEKALILLKIDDIQDGKVLRSKLGTVTELNLSGSGKSMSDKIRSLVGVEAMTNLIKLVCNSNLITTLDVSKNLALKTLACSINSITALDVSKNTALTGLYCDFNLITELDISKNLSLNDVNCSVNKISTLDVTKNIFLDGLLCAENLLTTIDVSKNSTLKGLSCPGNKLVTLDITQNKQLENLNCDSNKLTILDVSNNMNLNGLYCSLNNLTGLNVSKNSSLIFFECTDNNIQTICVNSLTQPKTTWQKDLSATYKVCP